MSYEPRPHPPLVDEPPFPASAYQLPDTPPDAHGVHLRTRHYGVDGLLAGGRAPLVLVGVLRAMHDAHMDGVRLRTPCTRSPFAFSRWACRDWHMLGYPRPKGAPCHPPRPSP